MVNAPARERARQRRAVTAAAPARAVVRASEDTGPLQALQAEATAGELMDRAERMQDYGFASRPHPGAEAAVVFACGQRNHPLIVAVADRRYRLKGLATGEVALHDDQGQVVRLGRAGMTIETPHPLSIAAAGAVSIASDVAINLEAPQVSITAEAGVGITAGGTFSVAAAAIDMTAAGLARLAGAVARLYGLTRVVWEAAGTGFSFTPVARKYHYTGTSASEVPPQPPEIV